jgi:hypothetical protein
MFVPTHPLVAELVAGLAARGVEARGDASGGAAVVVVLGRASHEGLRVGVPHGHVHELVGRGVAERKHLHINQITPGQRTLKHLHTSHCLRGRAAAAVQHSGASTARNRA